MCGYSGYGTVRNTRENTPMNHFRNTREKHANESFSQHKNKQWECSDCKIIYSEMKLLPLLYFILNTKHIVVKKGRYLEIIFLRVAKEEEPIFSPRPAGAITGSTCLQKSLWRSENEGTQIRVSWSVFHRVFEFFIMVSWSENDNGNNGSLASPISMFILRVVLTSRIDC